MDQRLQFLSSYQKEEMSVADLCRAYGISRPTAYRWINRYDETGPEGLVDRSRRPHSCSHATLEAMENTILVLRAKHPSWGARKLKARLEMLQPDVVWPAASTFGNILNRAGLTSPQKKRKRTTPCSEPFSLVTGPNQLWCMDFKGYFITGDGKRCDPFTITDAYSRYLIRCQIVSRMDLSQVRAICEAAMREYGVPARIRTDNGAPFAGTGLLGLSKLSLGWMKLGTLLDILKRAGGWNPSLYLKIENAPYMALVIEATGESGPSGLPAISVAHYGEQNGDLMRDPEMCFELGSGNQPHLDPFYFRNDYIGVEQWSRTIERGHNIHLSRLHEQHKQFAKEWDNNLRLQGFAGAFERQQTPSS